MHDLNPKQIEYDGQVTISTGNSRKAKRWQGRNLQWSDLVRKLRSPTRTPETVAEYRAMAKADKDVAKDVGGFVGGALKEGRRRADCVAWRQVVTLDIDHAIEDPWPAVCAVGCAALLYSTHSHTPQAPRLRLVIPLARPVDADEYIAISRRIAGDIDINIFDNTTFEPHRLMYWPSCPQDGAFRAELQDLPWLDPDTVLAGYNGLWQDPAQWPHAGNPREAGRRLAERAENPREKAGWIGAFCRAYPISEAIDTFLADIYAPIEGGDRYTYTAGSSIGGLVVYDGDIFAYSHHGTDPASGKLCNAFDLVRIHRFGMRDDDAAPDTPGNRRPSYRAMVELVCADNAAKREYALEQRAAFAQAEDAEDEEATSAEEIKGLMQLLECGEKGPKQTINNILLLIENHPLIRGRYAHDDFHDRRIVLDDMPWQRGAQRATQEWTDADDSGLLHFLEPYNVTSLAKLRAALDMTFLNHRVHPVRAYLGGLPKWDGAPRLDSLFIDYLGAADTPYVRTVTRKALCGAVARILQPGVKHDHMLVLIGAQGTGKSSILRILGGEWFSDSLTTVQGKEASELLQGVWIVEMGELAATKKAEVETIKLFISKQEDNYRAAYAHYARSRPRQCAFFGTTNDVEFLHDNTGGRRFWPITIDQRPRKYDLWKALDSERAQIWAECLAAWQDGETLYLDRETEAVAREYQERHTEGNAKMGLIEDYVNRRLPQNWAELDLADRRAYLGGGAFGEKLPDGSVERERVCALEVWAECFGNDPATIRVMDTREINTMLRKLEGWRAYEGASSGKIRFGKLYGIQRAYVRS